MGRRVCGVFETLTFASAPVPAMAGIGDCDRGCERCTSDIFEDGDGDLAAIDNLLSPIFTGIVFFFLFYFLFFFFFPLGLIYEIIFMCF